MTEPERKALAKAGIQTTAELLKATAKRKARKALSKRSGVPNARLSELAAQCDLLRVKGLGPSAVRLLQAANIKHVASLRHTGAKALHGKLEAIKATLNLPLVVPDVAELSGWIAQARKLPRVLEGAR